MSNNSVSLHRVLKASPEKVFRAFSDTTAFTSWLPPYGFLCVAHQMEFKEGGTYKMTFTNFTTGRGESFGGKYLEIKPNEFLKYTDQFNDPNLPGDNDYFCLVQQGFVWYRTQNHPGRYPIRYTGRDVLFRMAGISWKN